MAKPESSEATVTGYGISRSRPVRRELARIARQETDLAISLARQIPGQPVRSVHKCRKTIKRLRAIVRLGMANGDDWRAIDRKFRDIGRILAEARDSHVLPRTATALTGEPESFPAPQGARKTPVPDQAVVDNVVALLEAAGGELEQHISSRGWPIETIRRAVHATRSTTASRMERFRASGRPVDAHSWRKGVQRYANQIRLLDNFLPDHATGRLDALNELARCLGNFHDLTVFRDAVQSGRIRYDKKTRQKLLDQVRANQRELRRSALDAGAELFGDRRDAPQSPPGAPG